LRFSPTWFKTHKRRYLDIDKFD